VLEAGVSLADGNDGNGTSRGLARPFSSTASSPQRVELAVTGDSMKSTLESSEAC
jgi:hypothetical protein